jgi:hypothetical protein
VKMPGELETATEQYTVGTRIGEGGSGIVIKVTDQSTNLFAAKILNPRLVDSSKRKRFKNA